MVHNKTRPDLCHNLLVVVCHVMIAADSIELLQLCCWRNCIYVLITSNWKIYRSIWNNERKWGKSIIDTMYMSRFRAFDEKYHGLKNLKTCSNKIFAFRQAIYFNSHLSMLLHSVNMKIQSTSFNTVLKHFKMWYWKN